MQYVVFWGGRCKRVVDGSELGVAVPKIRELSKVPTVVSAQPDRRLRRGWLHWGLEEESGYAGPESFVTSPITYQFPEFLRCLIHLGIIFSFTYLITKSHTYVALW